MFEKSYAEVQCGPTTHALPKPLIKLSNVDLKDDPRTIVITVLLVYTLNVSDEKVSRVQGERACSVPMVTLDPASESASRRVCGGPG